MVDNDINTERTVNSPRQLNGRLTTTFLKTQYSLHNWQNTYLYFEQKHIGSSQTTAKSKNKNSNTTENTYSADDDAAAAAADDDDQLESSNEEGKKDQ